MILSLLITICPIIYLQPIDDPIGFGREWFRLNKITCFGPDDIRDSPVFQVDPPGTYFEQWQDDTDGDGRPELGPGYLVWFTGPAGRYVIKADLPCGVHTEIPIELR